MKCEQERRVEMMAKKDYKNPYSENGPFPLSNAANNQLAVIMLQFKNDYYTLDEARKLIDEQIEIIKDEYSDFMISGGMYM